MTPTILERSRAVLAALLIAGFAGTARAEGDAAHDVPSDEIVTSEGTKPFEATYLGGYRLGRREPHYVRAALLEVGILATGTAYYWIWPTVNKRDWDFPDYATRMAQFKPTFDSNLHVTNNLLHPFAGSLYYGSARLNGLSIPVAAAYDVGSAAAFEFFLEWLEKASINDLVVTPFGGLPAGEFFLHLGEYVDSAPEGHWWTTAGAIPFGVIHGVQRKVDGEPIVMAPPGMPADSLGFSSYHWHRFDTVAQASVVQNETGARGAVYDFLVEARIVSIPGFLRPGHFSLAFDDGNFTEARMKAHVGDDGAASLDLFFDANLWGRYAQDVSREGRGSASMIALDASYRFLDRTFLGRRDQVAIIGPAGPEVKLFVVEPEATFSLEGAAHLDFASIQSLAFPEYVDRYGLEGTRWVLHEQGYDYSFGWSAWARAMIQREGAELGARAMVGSWGTFDCCDRFDGNVTKNAHGTERIVDAEAWMSFFVPHAPVEVRVFAEHLGHTSAMGPFVVSHWDRRLGAGLGLKF